MKTRILMSLATLGMAGLLMTGCETDSGSTKRDECKRLLYAFCDHGGKLDCGTSAEVAECKRDMADVCEENFTASCQATDDDVSKVSHDIKYIIKSKTDCDALGGVSEYLGTTLGEIRQGPCGS